MSRTMNFPTLNNNANNNFSNNVNLNITNQQKGSLQNRLQRKLIQSTQRRFNQLMQMMIHRQLRSPGFSLPSLSGSDDLEDFLSRPLQQMFTRGIGLGRVERDITSTVLSVPAATAAPTTPFPAQQAMSAEPDICIDMRMRDRVCCNSALHCFDDLKDTLDKLDTAANDFSLASACRVVSSELKRDRQCVQQTLSRCDGPARLTLHTRFDNRIDNLYDQFYSHCKRDPSTFVTTRLPTLTPLKTTTIALSAPTVQPTTQRPVIPDGTRGSWQTTRPTGGKPNITAGTGATSSVGNGLIIAGVITGGLLLTIVLLLAVFCWCRRLKDSNGSDSSTWVFFNNRPKLFSSNRPRHVNNNKQNLVRQESSVYAEIDESIVNPNFKPPAPPNASYISPISEDDVMPPFNQSQSSPSITTRGQMSYGPILAANNNNRLFYHSVAVPSPNDVNNLSNVSGLGPRLPTRGYSTLSSAHQPSDDNSYITTDSINSNHPEHDDYEEPISAQSSVHYAQLDKVENQPSHEQAPHEQGPQEHAPDIPVSGTADASKPSTKPKPSTQPKHAVKVLPSNPITSGSTSSSDSSHPVAQPRRKRQDKDLVKSALEQRKNVTSDVLSNRDSSISSTSTKSSHHYFVLEKNQDMEYENSVSASQIV